MLYNRLAKNQLDHLAGESPLKLEGDDLVANRLEAFRQDYKWREMYVDMEECARLYERRTDQDSKSNGAPPVRAETDRLPRRNFIRKAIDDHHSVALQNIPKIKLVTDQYIDPEETILEQELSYMVMNISEKTINAYVKTLLDDSNFEADLDVVTKQTSIYGVSFFLVDLDRSLDTRKSAELRMLKKKPLAEWDDEDLTKYVHLSKRIYTKQLDSRRTLFQQGIRRYGEEMMRMSYWEEVDVNTARSVYGNENIMVGRMPNELLEDADSTNVITTRLVTYERFPYVYSKSLETMDGDETLSVEFLDWVLLKTVIVGGQLVERKLYGAKTDDDTEEIEEGSSMLPIVPIYRRESENHPYGYSVALQLKLSEEFINRMYFLIYKAARKAVASTGVFIHAKYLGEQDLARVNAVLDEGGAALIEGTQHASNVTDIRQMIQPAPYRNDQINPALIDAARSEERNFQIASDAADTEAVRRARSGAGKRTQVATDDRPKTISINLMSRGLELLYDTIWDQVMIHHSDQVTVPINLPNGSRQRITLNQKVERIIPVLDHNGLPKFNPLHESPDNPEGMELKKYEFVLNSTALNMKAKADGRTDLPHDMISKLQVLAALKNSGAIVEETMRDLSLSDSIKALDDMYRMQRQQALQAQQQAMLAQQAQGQQVAQPTYPALEQAGGMGDLLQDSNNDVTSGADDIVDTRGF